VRRACIDIGSNTTRLLVAECEPGQLLEIHQERAFTRIGQGLRAHGAIPPAKIAEVVRVVAEQLRSARDLGADEVRGVATAAIRRAANGPELTEAILAGCGLRVNVLSGAEEARLAFVGAAGTLGRTPEGTLGVVDVGGGSSELVIGHAPDQVRWSTSLRLGSGDLADGCLLSDPPSARELAEARARVRDALGDMRVPHPAEAVAVGGSATSLRRLAGPLLDPETFTRSLALLASVGATEIARRFALDRERVRLLPAGLLILQAAAERFGTALQIGRGGVREGVLLEVSGA
jgi:exopolyphosphatase / guanosine-5'-triphosphate,3'-diphosphate pyrophosphatase